jgi:glutamate/tyrosine decarboxylase-like PLP-dependent enzyme
MQVEGGAMTVSSSERPRTEMADFRETGHRLVDMLADLLEDIEYRTLFPDITPSELARLFDEPLPREGIPLGDVVTEIERKLIRYCAHVNHPGYFGLITPSPTPAGILGDLIASALNQNVGAYTIGPSGVAMERRVVRWLTDLVGYDENAGGHLTSGGMVANFTGLKLARDWASRDAAQHDGVTARWAAYTSEERHVSVDKAADAIGIGRKGLRVLPTGDRFEVRIDALEDAIAHDKAAGVRPMCIVAMGGSTNTGAVDALVDLRRIADREHMWLHVDAAYGGGMLLSHDHPGVLRGIERADSITIDPHKWFYAPLDAGAILAKDARRLTTSFGMRPAYLTDEKDIANERFQYYVHSLEQSRRLRALKVWMTFKRYGADEVGRWVDANVAQARHLHALAEAHPNFAAATLPRMSAVCIRYHREGLDQRTLAELHADVARKIEEDGQFWISTTELKDHTWFRVNPVNFRTRMEHIDALFSTLVDECTRAIAEPRSRD